MLGCTTANSATLVACLSSLFKLIIVQLNQMNSSPHQLVVLEVPTTLPPPPKKQQGRVFSPLQPAIQAARQISSAQETIFSGSFFLHKAQICTFCLSDFSLCPPSSRPDADASLCFCVCPSTFCPPPVETWCSHFLSSCMGRFGTSSFGDCAFLFASNQSFTRSRVGVCGVPVDAVC